jgi:DHA1 family bicyclomycin/chloramphenicol resistance-like MFS transporter
MIKSGTCLSNRIESIYVISTLGILTAIGSISIDMYLPAFDVMADYFNVPIARIETTVTLFLFGMAFGQIFIGPVSDVWGRKMPLRVGLSIYILSSICCVMTNSFALFIILRFVQGLAGSACQVISRALVNDIYHDKNNTQIFTLLQIIMGISPILSPLIGGMLANEGTWKYLFIIMAAVSGIGMLGCLTVLPAGKPSASIRMLNFNSLIIGYAHCLQHPAFVNYALVRSFSNSAAFVLITASPFVFTKVYGLNSRQYGFVFSGLAIGIICAGIINTHLIKRFDAYKIIKSAISCQIATGILMIVGLFVQAPFWLLLGAMIIFLAMLGLILPTATSLYIRAVPSHGGTGSALLGSLSYLSAFLITSLLNLLYNHTAYPMIIIMWCCAVLAYFCLHYKNPDDGLNRSVFRKNAIPK